MLAAARGCHEIVDRPSITTMSNAPPSNRKFGLTFAGGLLGLTALAYWRRHAVSEVLVGVAGGIALVALAYPRLLTPVKWLWLKIETVLRYVNSRLLLTIIYFVLITPTAMFLGLARRRPLARRSAPATSYWHWREPSHPDKAMEHQF